MMREWFLTWDIGRDWFIARMALEFSLSTLFSMCLTIKPVPHILCLLISKYFHLNSFIRMCTSTCIYACLAMCVYEHRKICSYNLSFWLTSGKPWFVQIHCLLKQTKTVIMKQLDMDIKCLHCQGNYLMQFGSPDTHTHTHTHTYIYIYIYKKYR